MVKSAPHLHLFEHAQEQQERANGEVDVVESESCGELERGSVTGMVSLISQFH